MKKWITNNAKELWTFGLLLGCLWGCTREEFMPPPVGEPIPYTDTSALPGLSGTLATSPYTLFYKAWQRSNMDERLPQVFTLLVLDNAAMQTEGWDEAAIQSAIPADLDTLLMRHVFSERVTPEHLQGSGISYRLTSLAPLYRDGQPTSVLFKASVGLNGGQVLVNGNPAGTVPPIEVDGGYIWPVDRVLTLPTMNAWEALQQDERFSLYVQLVNYTDALYDAVFEETNGFSVADAIEWFGSFPRRDYYGMRSLFNINSTWFMPTDEAFHRAGFYSIEDLMNFNVSRGWQPVADIYDEINGFYVMGDLPTDSLLDYHHNWGLRYIPPIYTYGGGGIPLSINISSPGVFYSSDLRQEALGNYLVHQQSYSPRNGDVGSGGLGFVLFTYYMPFLFFNDGNGQVSLYVKNSGAEAATVSLKDISVQNGVVHGLDGILFPPGFSLN